MYSLSTMCNGFIDFANKKSPVLLLESLGHSRKRPYRLRIF